MGVRDIAAGALRVISGRWEVFLLLVALGAVLGTLISLPLEAEIMAMQSAAEVQDEQALMAAFRSLFPDLLIFVPLKIALYLLLPVLWVRFVRLGGGAAVLSGLVPALWRSFVLLLGVLVIFLALLLGLVLLMAILSLLGLGAQQQRMLVGLAVIAAMIPLEIAVARGLASTALGRPMSAIEGFVRLRGSRTGMALFLIGVFLLAIVIALPMTIVFADSGEVPLVISLAMEALNHAIWLLLVSAAIPFAIGDESGESAPPSD
ncbi:MAG: hypothetical protein Tsb008_21360 [Rhodothalassiaceae bacterium]